MWLGNLYILIFFSKFMQLCLLILGYQASIA
jgi:hypothetical protein